jgi:serine/threonine protein kinase
VKYYGWCIDVEEKQNEIVGAQLYLVMELCESDLACRVFGNSQLSVKESIDIALSIASGMQYLHEHGYIHKDLKFDNVLVTNTPMTFYLQLSGR